MLALGYARNLRDGSGGTCVDMSKAANRWREDQLNSMNCSKRNGLLTIALTMLPLTIIREYPGEDTNAASQAPEPGAAAYQLPLEDGSPCSIPPHTARRYGGQRVRPADPATQPGHACEPGLLASGSRKLHS